jgi:hypothetical protein
MRGLAKYPIKQGLSKRARLIILEYILKQKSEQLQKDKLHNRGDSTGATSKNS